MWLQQGSHHSVGFLVRIMCLSKQNPVWRRKKACKDSSGEHAELNRRVKGHHAGYILDHKENLSLCI